MQGFRLQKFYMDVVTPEGACAVAYWAKLKLGPLHRSYSAILALPLLRPRVERQAWSGAPPKMRGERCDWTSRRLGAVGRWSNVRPLTRCTLLDSSSGKITWQVLQSAGDACIGLRSGARYAGVGYVESLTLDILPWRLPFAELRWGRFISSGGRESLVWIDWRRGMKRRWVLLNNKRVRCNSLSESVVEGDGFALQLAPGRVIRNERIATSVLGGFLPTVLPGVRSMRDAREIKWISRARLDRPGLAPVSGWALHEVVRWK
jgi:hypothetical protein